MRPDDARRFRGYSGLSQNLGAERASRSSPQVDCNIGVRATSVPSVSSAVPWGFGLASLALLLVLGLSAACAHTPGEAAEGAMALGEGRRLFERRCVQCHALHPPATRSDLEWAAVMGDMASEALLTEEQARLVLEYLQEAN